MWSINPNPSTVRTEQSNLNETNRRKWVTDLAAVSRGKLNSKNPSQRYKLLLKEAAPNACNGECVGKASRPLEFLPVVIGYTLDGKLYNIETGEYLTTVSQHSLLTEIIPYGYTDPISENGIYTLYTNMRALYNAGIEYKYIPYNQPETILKGKFFALRLELPMFVWAQLVTHTKISTESRSARVTEENDYWLPDDIMDRIKEAHKNPESKISLVKYPGQECVSSNYFEIPSDFLSKGVQKSMFEEHLKQYLHNSYSQHKLEAFFKELGYPREIYSRAIYYMRYKQFVMTGWGIDPAAWNHLFLERNATDKWKNWTQEQTRQAVVEIKQFYDQKYKS